MELLIAVENVPVQISDTFPNYKQHLKCVDEKKIKSQNAEIICAGVAKYGVWCAFSTEMCGSIGQLGPSCRLPTASPGRWIGGRPPDMVASCDLSR